MKKLLLLTLLLPLASCSTLTLQQSTYTNVVDYSEFAKEGIFVTESNSVNFEYTPLATVNSVTTGPYANYSAHSIDMDKVFAQMSDKLRQLKANGLINFRITNLPSTGLHTISVTGMAVYIDEVAMPLLLKRSKELLPEKAITESEYMTMVDDITCVVLEKKKSGVVVATDKELTPTQLKKAISNLKITNIPTRFYLSNSKQAYAGSTDNGYSINYKTNEFLKLSEIE